MCCHFCGANIETHNDPEQILAPVYGMVHTTDGMGYLAVIENGEEEASISMRLQMVLILTITG